MAAKVLNIEVGKRLVKICVSEKKGKGYAVSESFTFPTPDGTVLDGQVVSEVTLGDKLMGELANHDIKSNEVFFSVASSKIATREVTMPSVKDDQIKSIVQTNASDYLPIDTSKYALDAILLERTEEECRVLVIAVPNVIVESYIALADYTGLTISALDFAGNSQFQVLRTIDGEGVNMYVNVDTDSSSVTFVEDGQLLLQRYMPIGGDEMICRYMGLKSMEDSEYISALGAISETADDIAPTTHTNRTPVKTDDDSSSDDDNGSNSSSSDDDEEEDDGEAEIEDDSDDNGNSSDSRNSSDTGRSDNSGMFGIRNDEQRPEDNPFPELDDCLTRLVGGIIRSVDFFQGGKYTEKQIEKIVITGSCGHLRGLKTRIFESIGANTYWLEEIKSIQGLANSIDDISIYINCLGARVAPLNLLSADYIARTGKKKSSGINGDNFGIVAIIICAVIALALSGYVIGTNLYKNSQLKKIEAQIDQLAYAEDEYQDYVLYKAGDKDLQTFIDGYITPNSEAFDFLEEMENKMPTDISVLTANFSEEGVSLNCTTPGFEEAANVIRQFRSFASISVISVTSITKSETEGAGMTSFTINCQYPVKETTTVAPETTTETTTAG